MSEDYPVVDKRRETMRTLGILLAAYSIFFLMMVLFAWLIERKQ